METGQRTSNLPDPAPVGFLHLSLGYVRKQVLVKWLFTSTCNSAGVRAFIVTYDFRNPFKSGHYTASILFAYIVALLSLCMYFHAEF